MSSGRLDKRIFGIETEFGVTCTFQGQRRLTPDEVARYLFKRVVSWGRSSNVFLTNGARLYLDVGSHPEYATAECDDFHDLIVQDKAGERILEELIVDAQDRLAEEGIEGEIYLFKNNTDSGGNSYGCHENFLIKRRQDYLEQIEALLPFLITRQLICGAGKVLTTPQFIHSRSGLITCGRAYQVPQRVLAPSSILEMSPTQIPKHFGDCT